MICFEPKKKPKKKLKSTAKKEEMKEEMKRPAKKKARPAKKKFKDSFKGKKKLSDSFEDLEEDSFEDLEEDLAEEVPPVTAKICLDASFSYDTSRSVMNSCKEEEPVLMSPFKEEVLIVVSSDEADDDFQQLPVNRSPFSTLVAEAQHLNIARLEPKQWLNDAIINFFIDLYAVTLAKQSS